MNERNGWMNGKQLLETQTHIFHTDTHTHTWLTPTYCIPSKVVSRSHNYSEMQPEHETIKLWKQATTTKKHFFFRGRCCCCYFVIFCTLSRAHIKIIGVASSETPFLHISLLLYNRIAWHNWWLLHYNSEREKYEKWAERKLRKKLDVHRKCNRNYSLLK